MGRRVGAGERVSLMEMVGLDESVPSPNTLLNVGETLVLAVPGKGVRDSTGEGVRSTPDAVTLAVTVEAPPSPLGEARGEALGVGVGSLVALAEPLPATFPKREEEGGKEEDGFSGEAVASDVDDPWGEAVPPSRVSAGRDGEALEVRVLPPPPPAAALS